MKKFLAISLFALMFSTACSSSPSIQECDEENQCSGDWACIEGECVVMRIFDEESLVLNQEPVDFPSLDPSSEECAPMNAEYEYMYGGMTEWDIVNDEFFTHRQSDLALFFAYLACDGEELLQEKFTDGMTSGKVYVAFKEIPDPELAVLLEELGFTFHEDRYDGYQVYVLSELVEIMTLEPLKNYYPYFSSSWGDINK